MQNVISYLTALTHKMPIAKPHCKICFTFLLVIGNPDVHSISIEAEDMHIKAKEMKLPLKHHINDTNEQLLEKMAVIDELCEIQ